MDFVFSSETLVLGNFNRISCLSVTVIDDKIYETDIEFIEVDLEIVNRPDGSLVTVEPRRTRIEITDNEGELIFLSIIIDILFFDYNTWYRYTYRCQI